MIWIASLLIAAILIALLAQKRWSTRFSTKSLRGKWESKSSEEKIYVELRAPDDETHSGTFVRVTEQKDGIVNEEGSWIHEGNQLRLMIFAYDGPGNIALGTVREFQLRVVNAQQMVLGLADGSKYFKRVEGFES